MVSETYIIGKIQFYYIIWAYGGHTTLPQLPHTMEGPLSILHCRSLWNLKTPGSWESFNLESRRIYDKLFLCLQWLIHWLQFMRWFHKNTIIFSHLFWQNRWKQRINFLNKTEIFTPFPEKKKTRQMRWWCDPLPF